MFDTVTASATLRQTDIAGRRVRGVARVWTVVAYGNGKRRWHSGPNDIKLFSWPFIPRRYVWKWQRRPHQRRATKEGAAAAPWCAGARSRHSSRRGGDACRVAGRPTRWCIPRLGGAGGGDDGNRGSICNGTAAPLFPLEGPLLFAHCVAPVK